MEKKSLFIKLDKHKEVNNLIQKIEKTKSLSRQKIDMVKEIMVKEKELLEKLEESLKKVDSCMDEATNLINTE